MKKPTHKQKSGIYSLRIKNLTVTVEDKEILHDLNLNVQKGTFHVVMGPNGSGKSTLTYAIMGHPNYKIKDKRSKIEINGKNILDKEPNVRVKLGVMLAFQNPIAVPGVTLSHFLRTAYVEMYGKAKMSILELHKYMQRQCEILHLDKDFLKRSVNDGFSGGEKKKAEMLQLLVLQPKYAIFDEIDTGLDVDALKTVASGINLLQKSGCGILLITHYQRILNYVHPDRVHIMVGGKIVREGDATLSKLIEEQGYGSI